MSFIKWVGGKSDIINLIKEKLPNKITMYYELFLGGVLFLMSNSYTPWIIENFKEYNQEKINCRRRINSKNPESKENEIFIWNYQIEFEEIDKSDISEEILDSINSLSIF